MFVLSRLQANRRLARGNKAGEVTVAALELEVMPGKGKDARMAWFPPTKHINGKYSKSTIVNLTGLWFSWTSATEIWMLESYKTQAIDPSFETIVNARQKLIQFSKQNGEMHQHSEEVTCT